MFVCMCLSVCNMHSKLRSKYKHSYNILLQKIECLNLISTYTTVCMRGFTYMHTINSTTTATTTTIIITYYYHTTTTTITTTTTTTTTNILQDSPNLLSTSPTIRSLLE